MKQQRDKNQVKNRTNDKQYGNKHVKVVSKPVRALIYEDGSYHPRTWHGLPLKANWSSPCDASPNH